MLIQFHSHFPSFKLFTETHTDIHTHTHPVRNIRSRTLVSHPDPVSIIASRPPQNTTQLRHPKVDRFQTTLLKDCFQASFGRPLCAPRLSGPHRNRTVSHSGKRDVSARGGVAHTSLQHITLPGMPVQDCSVPFSLGTNVNSNRAGLQAFGVDEVFRLSTGPDTKLPVCVALSRLWTFCPRSYIRNRWWHSSLLLPRKREARMMMEETVYQCARNGQEGRPASAVHRCSTKRACARALPAG